MDGGETAGTQQQQKLLELVYENTRNPASSWVNLYGEQAVLKHLNGATCVE